jgi:hypothetical protein
VKDRDEKRAKPLKDFSNQQMRSQKKNEEKSGQAMRLAITGWLHRLWSGE